MSLQWRYPNAMGARDKRLCQLLKYFHRGPVDGQPYFAFNAKRGQRRRPIGDHSVFGLGNIERSEVRLHYKEDPIPNVLFENEIALGFHPKQSLVILIVPSSCFVICVVVVLRFFFGFSVVISALPGYLRRRCRRLR